MSRYYILTQSDMQALDALGAGAVCRKTQKVLGQNVKILVVGLGGVGVKTLCRLKQTLLEQLEEVPDHQIRFLALDTDASELHLATRAGTLSQQETLLMYNHSLASAMSASVRPAVMEEIWPPRYTNFQFALSGMGANQIRLAGRLALMDSELHRSLRQKLRQAITEMGNDGNQRLEVHVIAGLGGSTGGGMCVDIPYLIRSVASELGVPDPGVRVLGHLYLPDIYDHFSTTNSRQLHRNAYAALKEIDYYMTLEQTGERFDAMYPEGVVSSAKNIFSSCTLIGGRRAEAGLVQDPFQAAIATCVEYLLNLVTGVGTGGNGSMAGMLTSSMFRNNLGVALRTVQNEGGCGFHTGGNYPYSCIGIAAVKFPSDDIAEYLISASYEKMMARMAENANMLQQAHVDAFAEGLAAPMDLLRPWLERFERAASACLAGCELDRESVKQQWLEDALMTEVSHVKRAFEAAQKPNGALCQRAAEKAAEIFRDPDRGPCYLARLLTADSLQDGVAGYFELLGGYGTQCDQMMESLRHQQEFFRQELKNMREAMRKPFCFRRYLEEYKQAVCHMRWIDLQLWLCERLRAEYVPEAESGDGLCCLLRQTLSKQYLQIVDVLTYVDGILGENAKRCYERIFESAPADSVLSLDFPGADMLKKSVRQDVERKTKGFCDRNARDLQAALTAAIEADLREWAQGGNGCVLALRRFVVAYPAFREHLCKGWNEYLDEAYGPCNSPLRTAVMEQLEKHLDVGSAPMFRACTDFSWSGIQKLAFRYMTVPDNLRHNWNTQNKTVIACAEQNTICQYTMYAGLPAWLYRDMAEYEQCYCQSKDVGVHINENPAFDPPYRQYPPLLPPQQWHRFDQGELAYRNEQELEFRAGLEDTLRKAEQLGILTPNEMGYYEVVVLSGRPEPAQLEQFCQQHADTGDTATQLWKAMQATWGTVSHAVLSLGDLAADRWENLPELLRKQMKLVGKLRRELAYAQSVSARVAEACGNTAYVPSAKLETVAEEETRSDPRGYMFISYSTKNQSMADAMRDHLKKHGVRVWMAPGDIPAGSKYAQVINKAIRGCAGVVLMLSNDAQNSIWVAKEIERAVNYRKTVIPVKLEELVLNDEFELYISTDQVVAVQKVDDDSEEMKRLMKSVRVLVDGT